MTDLAELRKPFAPEVIGKLPRLTQKEGSKSRCNECGGYLPPHIHLDYVGHAEVTDRLLSVDPMWNWEPFALDADGLPLIRNGRLWIRLTVLGVTRIGCGTVNENKIDLEKELISDAIRNAAMRFGVALDLWAKADLESQIDNEPQPATPPVRRGREENGRGQKPPDRTPAPPAPDSQTGGGEPGDLSIAERVQMLHAQFDALPPASKNAYLKEERSFSLPSLRSAARWDTEQLDLAEMTLNEITASAGPLVRPTPPQYADGEEPFQLEDQSA